MEAEHATVIVIGGGQSGLVTGYHLKKAGRRAIILDAHERIGDEWRARWDSLRLFTPARFNGLDGMAFPGPKHVAPTKDEFADYLESYARRFDLDVRLGMRVDSVRRDGDRYVVRAGEQTFSADSVVVATGAHQRPRIPAFARDLDPSIRQMHSREFRNDAQLADGPVLLVGAANSGADIAMDLIRFRPVVLAGKHPNVVPFRIDTFAARFLVRGVRFVGHRVLTWGTPVGRKALPKLAAEGRPLVRVKPGDLTGAGVERVGRITGVRDGKPVTEDGRALDVANVIWCTGFTPEHAFIDLPVFGEDGTLAHARGVAEGSPGLYFVGLDFQYAATSETITGVSRDARYVTRRIAAAARAATAPAGVA